uniref:Uncharacterized protein n=1 Tax=Quercus lobata TaxID=97700 RepID=A0A7N2N271_QUELO
MSLFKNLSVISFLFITLCFALADAARFDIINNCPYTVCPYTEGSRIGAQMLTVILRMTQQAHLRAMLRLTIRLCSALE